MKIIGKSGRATFIVEATAQELDKLAGRQLGWSDYSNEQFMTMGTEFHIEKAFSQIHRNKQRKQEIDTVRKTLEGVLNSLDIIEPFIEEPKVEEPAAEVLDAENR